MRGEKRWTVWLGSVLFAMMASASFVPLTAQEMAANSDFERAVFADWAAQEEDRGRTIGDDAALSDLVRSGGELLEVLTEEEAISPQRSELLRAELDRTEGSVADRYIALRRQIRAAALENPLIADSEILFHKGNRFVCQMLHEYLSFFYRYTNRTGGGIYRLKEPGRSMEIESVTDGAFAKGVFMTPTLSYDAKTVYFAFADFSGLFDDGAPVLSTDEIRNKINGMGDGAVDFYAKFMTEPAGKFHLYKMSVDGGEPVQLTDGCDDDFDPVEIPGGDIVFMSTRRGGFGRCHGTWEPLPVHTLHRLSKNGEISTLSWHETNEWQPSVLHDGRIIYTRWDYVDRSASHHHGLWITNPDGTGAVSLFGNYTYEMNACYQAKAIPDSNKILFVPGAHHLDVGGPLVLLDPKQVRYDPAESLDTFDALTCLSPEIPYPEAPNQCPETYYFSPWPLSEDFYLTAYSHDPLGGMLSQTHSGTTGRCGLYYRDRFGNLELLYEDPTISCQYPIPLAARDVPPQIPSQIPATSKEKADKVATVFLSNVNESLTQLPADRPIKELRVFQVLPKYPDHRSDHPEVGFANAQNARIFLGTVPIESDGSAYFRVPAQKPLYFQAVDETGRAVQSMRSEVYFQPGENRGCVGCHEQAQTAFKNEPGFSAAFERGPSQLAPGPDGTFPMSYPRLIQPILDQACVSCHNESGTAPNLTGGEQGIYTVSYESLKPYLRWYEWGENTYRETSTLPGGVGADISPLSDLLEDENHGEKIGLTDEQKRTLYLWMDANVPFYGDTDYAVQARQKQGEAVEPAKMQ